MLLEKIRLTDFLSVRGTISIDIDKKVTVLLGSNDHGKSNILAALQHLNDDFPIGTDEPNWDRSGEPAIEYVLRLSKKEQKALSTILKELQVQPVKERAKESIEAAEVEAEAQSPEELSEEGSEEEEEEESKTRVPALDPGIEEITP